MNIDYLIEQLQYTKKDVGDSKIVHISYQRGMIHGDLIQIKFDNGVITQIMEPAPWPVYNLKG